MAEWQNEILDDLGEEKPQKKIKLSTYRFVFAVLAGTLLQNVLNTLYYSIQVHSFIELSALGGNWGTPLLLNVGLYLLGARIYCFFAGKATKTSWLILGVGLIIVFSSLWTCIYLVMMTKGGLPDDWLRNTIIYAGEMCGIYISMICFVKSRWLLGFGILVFSVFAMGYLGY